MLKEARVPHMEQLPVIRLELDRVFCEHVLSIFQSECILKEIDNRWFSCESPLSIQKKVPETRIARLVQYAGLAESRKGAMQVIRFKLSSAYPSQDFGWTVTPIFSFLMSEMLLIIIINDPFLVCRH